jgi:protein subunit release factor A
MKYIFGGKHMKKVIEIRAAEGGDDSKLFVRDLAQAYIKFAQSKG